MLLQPLFVVLLATVILADPPPPPLTYLYTANLTMPSDLGLKMGTTPLGERRVIDITGGTFSGPKMNGTVAYGLDWGLTDTAGFFREDTVMFLQTNDGANIFVIAKGQGDNVHHTFETGHENYTWLNNVIGYARGIHGDTGVQLQVWQVGPLDPPKNTTTTAEVLPRQTGMPVA